MNSAERYAAIGRLIEAQPSTGDLKGVMRWMGRAAALVRDLSPQDAAGIRAAASMVRVKGTSDTVLDVNVYLYTALALAELEAPLSLQGSFIHAGNALDAMSAVGKVVRTAKTKLLIVDPYMDEKALTDFALLADEGVSIDLLADAAAVKPSLSPAAQRWRQQYAGKRPLEVRVAAAKTLHDRLIVADDTTVWTLTQSLNAFAARSPASIVRIDGDSVALKLGAYVQFWATAAPLP